MRIARARLFGLSSAVCALAVGAFAVPAHAAEPTLTVTAPGFVAVDPTPDASDSWNQQVSLNLNVANSGTQSPWVVAQIDVSGLKGIADVQPPSGCTLAGTLLTCPQIPVYQGQTRLDLKLTPAKGGTVGATGSLHVSAHLQQGDAPAVTADTKVMLGGTRLTGQDVPLNKSLKPGDVWKPDLVVTNKGQVTAPQLVYVFTGGMGLDFKSRFANCEYGTNASGEAVICTVDSPLAPGGTARLDPVEIGVEPSAYYAYEDISVLPQAPAPDSWVRSFHFTPGPAGSPRLTVGKPESTPQPGQVMDLTPNGGGFSLQAEVPNTTDFATFGAWAPGADGKPGKLTVGMTSSGPATIYWRAGDDPGDVAVTLPKQVKVVSAPDKCRPDTQFKSDTQTRYICQTSPLVPAGFKGSFDFTLQADPAAGASAVVSLSSLDEGDQDSGMPWDPNKADNTSTVALGSQASGSVPTGGTTVVPVPPTAPATAAPTSAAAATPSRGTGGTTAPAADTGAATPSTATPSGAARATASSTAAADALAFTGAQGIGTMTGLGVGALTLGGVLTFVVRRRKAGAHS
ncbi:hypothetical protein OG500_21025 [Kitasatospora sp. NBC_01250]|uniref:hypothetical protein n=1 Tax=unclassified Kitasatospora TaxID=2633591 RepID=UPI002E117F34|nr:MULTISPECIES: hypothetical protein [unclassified Kitasatospora]WSJ68554.1 hypothetical protein OG294_21870 [Kitasatospora sp. NBC_01302]